VITIVRIAPDGNSYKNPSSGDRSAN